MQKNRFATNAACLLGLAILWAGAGCFDIQGSGSSSSERISPATADTVAETPAAGNTGTRTNSSAASNDDSPSVEPSVAPSVAPASADAGGGTFLWEPRSDSVRIVIPASLPHWQLNVFSRRRHMTLYGPDNRGGNRAQNVEYILSGGGAVWRQKSLDAGDDGTLLVFINTRYAATGSLRNAGWRIMNPSARQSGDGDRLVAGENR